MKKALILMLAFAAFAFAAEANSEGDVLLSSPYKVNAVSAIAAGIEGFDVGTKGSTEIIRDLWVGSDFDQDGNKEVLLASYSTSGRAYVYEIDGDNNATLFFDTGEMGGGYSSSVRHVAYGDLDGNGMQELLVSVNASDNSKAGIWAFEYDTVGDSMRAPVQLFNETVVGDRWYVENFTVGDADGDGVQEVIWGNNGSANSFDNFYIASVESGTFADDNIVTKVEFTHGKSSSPFPAGGSPYGGVLGDMDGDGDLEILFAPWDNGALFIVEATGTDTYTPLNYIEVDLDVRDDFAFYDFVAKDLNGDGRDEAYLSMYDGGRLYVVTCPEGTDLSALTTANVHTIDALGSSGGVCTQLGDLDGNGKMNIYASGGGSSISNHEFIGTDPTDPTHWTKLDDITSPSFSGVYGMRYAEDLDGDGNDEIYAANTGTSTIACAAVEDIPPVVAPAVFFSEYIEGSSNNKAIEIYNATDETINLDNFAFPSASNGSDGTFEYWNTFTAGATVAPGDVWVVAHPSAAADILDIADQTFTYLSNGDDGFALAYVEGSDTLFIDWIGDFGPDPGDGWDVAGVTNATQDHTLIRKSSVKEGNTWAESVGTDADDSEWIVYPQDTFDYLGEHPSYPKVFFSEYIEGSSNNKAIEIYNGTDETINLDNFAYPNASNGSDGTFDYWNTFTAGATLAPGEVWVIAHPSADAAILDVADQTHYYLSNGDDGFALAYIEGADTAYIDWIGDFGPDPGDGWDVAGVTNATQDHTLVRKTEVTKGNTWANSAGTDADDSEWEVYPQDTFDYLGEHPTIPVVEEPEYYIPQGEHDKGFATLKAAVDYFNTATITEPIVILLDADTLREESFTFAADLDEVNNMLIKPAPGRDVVLIVGAGASQGNGDQMIGFDLGYVTFDGSNDGSDSRNLIVTTETDGIEVPFGVNTADGDNVVIKNLIIKNLDNVETDFKYGAVTNDIGGIEGFVVDNCQIGSPEAPVWRDGVAVWGSESTGLTDGIVTNCDIHAGARGISTYFAGTCEFAGNNVTLYPTATIYNYNYGIYCSWVNEAEVYDNVITSAEATTGGVTKVGGIVTASHPEGAEFNVYNNMVSVADAAETVPVYGLLHMSSSDARNWNVYHNTFEVNGAGECYGIGNSSTGPVTMDLKNNIIINDNAGTAASAAIYLVDATTVLTSNNNILVSAEKLASLGGTDYADLADWQAAGYDSGSDSLAVTFASATDLHLAAPSDTDLDLVMPALTAVTEDIDGDARGAFYAYAGADEGTAYPASNDLDLTFDDATDVPNWSHHDEPNLYTVEANDDSTLRLSDAGYGMIAKRPVSATYGSVYKLSIDIKTSGWDAPVDPLILSVQGLGNDAVVKEIVSEGTWSTFTLLGIADGEDGYIRIYGDNVGAADTVWVDNVVWDDQYMELIPSANIAAAKEVPDGDYAACTGVVTATTIGAPIFMQDATAGISLYDWDFINDGIVKEGDEILVVGKRSTYNGLVQMQNTDENYVVLSEGNPVEPTLITVPDLDSRAYQGMLVMIEDVDTVAGFSWPAEGSDATITLIDKDSNEFALRIDKDGNMDGAPVPEPWPLDLVGVVGEFYSPQIMPRYIDDFLTNSPPEPFTMLNPVDGDTITSLDDSAFVDVDIEGVTTKAVLFNWTKAVDPDEGDSVVYQLSITPDGPEDPMVTADTFMVVPVDTEKPWNMNGTYDCYVVAKDLKGEVINSDTVTVTMDFQAPPEVLNAEIVLVDGSPTYYAEFSMPIAPDVSNFKLIDWSDEGAVTDASAIDYAGGNFIMVSGDITEDHWYSLAYSGVPAATDTSATPLTVTDTTKGSRAYVPFSDKHPEDAVKMLESFESSVGKFQHLTYSGSTSGILSTSTFDVSDEEAYQGSKSGKMTILDDPDTDGGWFIRVPYDFPSYNTKVKASSTLLLLVKGSNANVDIALTIKDSGYERNMWKSVTLSEDDWQVVSFDILNDPVEGWVTGNGEVTGSEVTICDLHINSTEDADVTLYVDGFTERPQLSPVDVTLNVMMHEWLRQGKFNLATDYVDVAGTMNGWGSDEMLLSDTDSDTTYSITIPLLPYSTHQFKFRINGSWNDATAEFPYGGPAREITVGETASEHTYWYNDDTLEVAAPGIPKEFALHQNYPNPFNPTTTINFDLPATADVKLVIYDIAGRKVRTLVDGNIDAGYKKIVWNGRDDFGNGVATGMYIYRLVTGDFVDVKKMTFLK
jgi:hypothetical protein